MLVVRLLGMEQRRPTGDPEADVEVSPAARVSARGARGLGCYAVGETEREPTTGTQPLCVL